MSTGRVSLRQLGRLIGVNEKAIRKAHRSGVFAGSIVRDGAGVPVVTDLELAISEWERSGRQLRGSARPTKVEQTATPEPETPAAPEPTSAAAEDVPAAPAAIDGPMPRMSLVDAQREAMLERARKLRLENDAREGELVEAGQAGRAAFEFARTLREAVLNVPARLSAELAAESDAGRVYRLLDAALRQALEATAVTLEASA